MPHPLGSTQTYVIQSAVTSASKHLGQQGAYLNITEQRRVPIAPAATTIIGCSVQLHGMTALVQVLGDRIAVYRKCS